MSAARWSPRRLLRRLSSWATLPTVVTLADRFREDRIALTAGGLTFASVISAVPLATVALALFSAFPKFGTLQEALQSYFLRTLVPDTIARPVLDLITQFTSRADRLGGLGLLALLASALAIMLTIDRTLNNIWRVRRPRPLAQRILIYWSAITLAPLVAVVSLAATSAALPGAAAYVDTFPRGWRIGLGLGEFAAVVLGAAALFHFVPNTHVRWRHAVLGGLFVATGLAIARRLLAAWFGTVPALSLIYGAFATLPIILVWIYLSWTIVLLGAIVAAYTPLARTHVARWPDAPGSRFALALATLQTLAAARRAGTRGKSVAALSAELRVDPLQIDALLDVLTRIDWVGRLAETGPARHVLLVEPAATPAAPLVAALLLDPQPEVGPLWRFARFDQLTLADVLPH